jgi:hypothetical protein
MPELSLPSPRAQGGLCSICQSDVLAGEPMTTCDSCHAVYHADCWRHNDGCGTYGCGRAPESRKVVILPGEQAGIEPGAWGDTKVCPSCGEYLVASALECPRCHAVFETRAPMSSQDYEDQQRRRAALRRATFCAIALFVASAFGILAPITLAVGGSWALARRRLPRRPSGAAELLVYGSIALSATYVVLLVAIFVAGW